MIRSTRPLRLAIVGTAGRGVNPEDAWPGAEDAARRLCRQIRATYGPLELGSGGAARGDALAPQLFLEKEADALTLFLPAPFDRALEAYVDPGYGSPGGISNHYHRRAVAQGGRDGLRDLGACLAIANDGGPARIRLPENPTGTARDFFERNGAVAAWADAVLAITFGGGRGVRNGGTMDTVQKFLARGVRPHVTHHDLSTGETTLAAPHRLP